MGWKLRCALVVSFFPACTSDNAAAVRPDAATTGDAAATPDAGGPTAPSGGTLGAECATNADCIAELSCVTGTATEKLVKGVCSIECTENSDCTKYGGGACWRIGDVGKFCAEKCTTGAPEMTTLVGTLDTNKCHGRRDMGCAVGVAADGGPPPVFCLPVCNDHSECESGMKCHLGRGVCTTEAVAPYSEIGNPESSCPDGFRASINGVQFCSAKCTLGVVPSCGWAGPGTKADAVCSITWAGAAGYGDDAKCSRMCDCDSDCPAPLRCHTSNPIHVSEHGRAGVCLPGNGGLVPACADAGVDASIDAPADASDAADGNG